MARTWTAPFLMVAGLAFLLAGCGQNVPPHLRPLSPETKALLQQKGMREDAPIFVRIFKEEKELEVWKVKDDGHYYHFKTYPICNYSGDLGPKEQQGDKQSPEGFYQVAARQMNPNSSFYLSFNLGYPNAFDRAHNRTGKHLMVHGDCRSAGCYAMTDALIEEIYALAREAFRGGQEAFWVHAYPFRMTKANMRRHARHKWYPFWRNLQPGYEHFEYTRIPPKVDVCEKRYLVDVAFVDNAAALDPAGPCPAYEQIALEAAPKPAPVQTVKDAKAAKTAELTADTRETDTPAAQATIGRGYLFGLGPAKPSYSAFGFRANATLGK